MHTGFAVDDRVAASYLTPRTTAHDPDVRRRQRASLVAAVSAGATPGHHSTPALALAALGIVFGDIGTSPLYSLQTVFAIENHAVTPTREDVFGVISMVFWSITLIVSFKYVVLVMRADNDGEGGILALVHLLRDKLSGSKRLAGTALLMGIVGAGLFYGDSVITPAISVMSAFEGLTIVNAGFESLVLPLSVVILTALFSIQRWGTAAVGKLFGPIMIVWFGTLAAMGVPWIVANPSILAAVSPTFALSFVIGRPALAFIVLGAVVLTITGAEALYADMGHFGARPVRLAWFFLVFPTLTLNYLGQGAMILSHPDWVDNPFFRLVPGVLQLPLVILAAVATIIASQAVISGAYSVSRQATRLGLLPRLNVKHTPRQEGGQIYISSINWVLFGGVLLLIGVFQSSAALASAYGLAVTGTLILTTGLFVLLARTVWHVAPWKIATVLLLVLVPEVVFFSANLTKLLHGGWLPVVIATAVVTIMLTWRAGSARVDAERRRIEGPLDAFVTELQVDGIPRVPGLAVFPHPNQLTTPLALRQNVAFNHVLHESIVIVSIVNENVPHVPHVDRASVHDLGHADLGIVHVSYRVGFNDSQDVPRALLWSLSKRPELNLDPDGARFFLSSLRLSRVDVPALRTWRKSLFLWLASVAANRTSVFHLPPERTIVMGGELKV